jgi:FixJ family two-component response regulator
MNGNLSTLKARPADSLTVEALARGHHSSLLREQARLKVLHSRHSYLSPREREVMDRIVSGQLNKQVALDLGIPEGTIKVHRFNVMRKMRADSFADLVEMASRLRNSPRRW